MSRFLSIAIWVIVSASIGALGSYFFNLSFWVAAGIAAGALVVNGLIAEIEDRQ